MDNQEPAIGCGAIVTACGILANIGLNAPLESMLREYGLDGYVSTEGTIANKIGSLEAFATQNPTHRVKTDFGEKLLSHVIIGEAIHRINWSPKNGKLWDKLERYLNLDGYALQKEVETGRDGDTVKITDFTVAMPEFVQLPESANEVDELLSRFNFEVAIHHLASAKENIAQGDWEAANSQCRTFLEALTDAIADTLYPDEAALKTGGLQKRQLLANKDFLSRDKHEFGNGSGQAFLPGLAKLLHSDGSHPGISTQHDAMFRLQVVVVTARWLLKRLEKTKS